jgi:ArsR family transcriptional regulator
MGDTKRRQQLRKYFELHSEVCRSISHPRRLHILYALEDGEMAVAELAKKVGFSGSSLSQHLNILKQANIIRSRRRGRQLLYQIANPLVMEAIHIMARVVRETCHKNVEVMDLNGYDESLMEKK